MKFQGTTKYIENIIISKVDNRMGTLVVNIYSTYFSTYFSRAACAPRASCPQGCMLWYLKILNLPQVENLEVP